MSFNGARVWSTGRASVTLSQLTGRQDKPTHLCEDGNTDAIILPVRIFDCLPSTQLNYQDSSTDVLSPSRLKSCHAVRTAPLYTLPGPFSTCRRCRPVVSRNRCIVLFSFLPRPALVTFQSVTLVGSVRPLAPGPPRPRKVDDELRRLGTAGHGHAKQAACLVVLELERLSLSFDAHLSWPRLAVRAKCICRAQRNSRLQRPELSVGEAGVHYCAAAIEHGEQSEGCEASTSAVLYGCDSEELILSRPQCQRVCLPLRKLDKLARVLPEENAARTDDALTAAVGIVGVVGVVGAFRTVDVVFTADANLVLVLSSSAKAAVAFRPLPLRPPLPSRPRTRPPPSPPPSAPLPALLSARGPGGPGTTPASNPTGGRRPAY